MTGVFGAPTHVARALRDALEPLAAHVYFAPEVHAAFAEIGFGPGVREPGSLTLPDLAAYFCSRAGALGQVSGPVVASVFGVFDPAVVVPEVERGWATASRDDVLAARERGATAALERMIGDDPGVPRATELLLRAARAGRAAGHPIYAGLSGLPMPTHPLAALWRAADLVREHRGDAHLAAWTAAGLDPVEAGLLTEVFGEMPRGRYHATRGWSFDALAEGTERLRAAGLLTGDPVAFTEAGAAFREDIEVATDRQQRPLLDALGGEDGADLGELLDLLRPWAAAIVAAEGFPDRIDRIPVAWGRPPS